MFDAPPGVYTDITVGWTHACALTEDGEAVCWDVAGAAAWDAPPGSYTLIEAEIDTTCAITDEGEIVCWSRGGGPIADNEPDPSRDAPQGRYTAIAWHREYTCGLTAEGAVVCWGLEGWYAAPPDPPPGSYTAIRVESYSDLGAHVLTACALADSGDLVCWENGHAHGHPFGPETFRRSGDFALVGDVFCDRSAEGAPSSLGTDWCRQSDGDDADRYVAVSPSESQTCAITGSGTVICEAGRSSSASGDIVGALSVMTPPKPSPGRYVAISTGYGSWLSIDHPPATYACALAEKGTAVCWGSVQNKVQPPEPSPAPYVAVSDGLGHTCALTGQGEVVCWGWNNFGQARVPPGRYTAISAGHDSTWAITDGGEVVRWGGDSPPWTSPTTERYVEVSAGGFNGACALTALGEVVCWPEETSLPQGPLEHVSLGPGGHGCALTERGDVVCFTRSWDRSSEFCGGSQNEGGCWGAGYGEEVTLEPPAGAYRMVSVGPVHACGVTATGDVACWDQERSLPPFVPAGPYVAVSVGTDHDCALTDRGEAHCWGIFGNRKLGTNYGPVDPPPGRFQAITSGHHRACALTETGEVVCWGDTDYRERPSFSRWEH